MTPHPIAGPPHPDLGIALDALAPEPAPGNQYCFKKKFYSYS